MNPHFCSDVAPLPLTRRDFLRQSWGGLGGVVMGALLHQQALRAAGPGAAAANPLAAHRPPLPAKAKRVVFIFMPGAPSQVDMWDPKPELIARDGQPPPASAVPNNGESFGMENMRLMRPISDFRKYGQSGIEFSGLLPHLAQRADDLCLLRGLWTDTAAHESASLEMNTGVGFYGRPSFGAWASYGLGTENENLPAFVAVGGNAVTSGCGFLPAIHQGTRLSATGVPIGNLSDPSETVAMKRAQFDLTQRFNRLTLGQAGPDPQLEGMIETMELAYRMQSEAAGLGDFRKESKATLDLYGIGGADTNEGARQCLLARRCLEAGVRFVLLKMGTWDHHGNIAGDLPVSCRKFDQPVAALLADLKQRGLLQDTLVVCTGEFGRTSAAQIRPNADASLAAKPGRDHNRFAFTGWMAGGGVKPGYVHGATDELGFNAVEGRVHVHDFHATLLRILGFDHTKLTYRYAGRDFRLTDVSGNVVKEVLA